MKYHALTIHVQPNNTALVWICSPAYGPAEITVTNPCQLLTLNDGENRVNVAVMGRKLCIEDLRRIARQAVDRDFDVRS